jgi:hypothetical protein
MEYLMQKRKFWSHCSEKRWSYEIINIYVEIRYPGNEASKSINGPALYWQSWLSAPFLFPGPLYLVVEF